MKKFLIILLLFIFSAQGAVVALGGGPAMAAERPGMAGMAQAAAAASSASSAASAMATEAAPAASLAQDPSSSDGLADIDDLKVWSSIEEMSDYVALDPALKQPRDRAANPPTIAPVLSSTDLPRASPPPRG